MPANTENFELAQFVNQNWTAARIAITDALPHSLDQVMAIAQWVETIGWLQLGSEMRMFPEAALHELLRVSREDLSKLLGEYGTQLGQFVPPALLIPIEGFASSGTVPTSMDTFERPRSLWPYLRAGLGLAQRGIKDRTAAAFQKALLLYADNQWSALFDGPLALASFVELAGRRDSLLNMESPEEALAGFVRTVDLMVLWQRLLGNIREDTGTEFGDRSTLIRRMGQATAWRVSLHEKTTRERFLEAAEHADKTIADLVALSPVEVSFRPSSFRQQVEQLTNDWLRDHPFYLEQQRSA
jgi:hypothetical protein